MRTAAPAELARALLSHAMNPLPPAARVAPPEPILVVDDAPDDTYFLRRTLKKAGLTNPVIGCSNGEEAVSFLDGARFGGQRPGLVFLDLRMPKMDGFEFLQWLRSHTEFADLKVIVISSSPLEEDRLRAAQLGCHQYVVKFPSPEMMSQIVADALADCAEA